MCIRDSIYPVDIMGNTKLSKRLNEHLKFLEIEGVTVPSRKDLERFCVTRAIVVGLIVAKENNHGDSPLGMRRNLSMKSSPMQRRSSIMTRHGLARSGTVNMIGPTSSGDETKLAREELERIDDEIENNGKKGDRAISELTLEDSVEVLHEIGDVLENYKLNLFLKMSSFFFLKKNNPSKKGNATAALQSSVMPPKDNQL
eukprot:TRINITY_DN6498_c0_g1_i4.p1 TRINITY_DN6498_c0_g1~~TRINITY_DN6498_c0_g1_i4.p1  ORF type:complete len:220 (+),score=42.68 TRINITY_DN6498_c0_g1_i4:61-660(+)